MKKFEQYTLVLNQSLEAVPTEIKIIPMGAVQSENGSFKVTDESFNLIERNFRKRAIDLVVDYEHQTLQDIQAPAAGWIKSLKKGEDAILAEVEWTAKAIEYLKNKEYKYLSPVIQVRKQDGVVIDLHSVALTNTPAINGMYPLVLKNINEEEKTMEFLKEIAEKLGVKISEEMADEEIAKAIVDAIPSQTTEPAEGEMVANKTILDLLQLKADAKVEDVTSKIMSLKADSADDGWKSKYEELENRMNKKEADELVLKALKEGKISKDQKEWAEEYALKDKKSFEKFLEKAPQVVPMGEIQVANSTKKVDLDDETTLEICKSMGVSKADIEKYGKDEE